MACDYKYVNTLIGLCKAGTGEKNEEIARFHTGFYFLLGGGGGGTFLRGEQWACEAYIWIAILGSVRLCYGYRLNKTGRFFIAK